MIWQAERMISAVTRMNSREFVLKTIGGSNAPKKQASATLVARTGVGDPHGPQFDQFVALVAWRLRFPGREDSDRDRQHNL